MEKITTTDKETALHEIDFENGKPGKAEPLPVKPGTAPATPEEDPSKKKTKPNPYEITA